MSSLSTRTTTMPSDVVEGLRALGLRATAQAFPDLLARAAKGRFSHQQLVEEVVHIESQDRGRRSLERRLQRSKIGRFKSIADFDWAWPKKIDRELVERALTLDFVRDKRNLVLLSTNGLGKTMIAKNVAFLAVQAGFSVLYRTASDLLADLACDSPEARRRRLRFYSRHDLLVIDEAGYLSYDDRAGDLLFEVVSRRHEKRSILLTTNLAFKDWNTVFPNAACIGTLLDRLLHHADVLVLEGKSYRVFESEQESTARRQRR